MKTRKPILENPVYSNIIYNINYSKIYISELSKKINDKNISALRKQLNYLLKNKYVRLEEYNSKTGKKYKDNKKYYVLNWNTLRKSFYDCFINLIIENTTKIKTKKEAQNSLLKLEQDLNFGDPVLDRSEIFYNPILRDYLSYLFKEVVTYFSNHEIPTLKELFEEIIKNNTLEDITQDEYIKELFVGQDNKEVYDSLKYFSDLINIVFDRNDIRLLSKDAKKEIIDDFLNSRKQK